MARFEQLSKFSTEIAQLRRALDENPDNIGARLELARRYLEVDHPQKALIQYQAILSFDPYHLETLRLLSILYLRKGENKRALELCQRAIEHQPDTEDIYKFY